MNHKPIEIRNFGSTHQEVTRTGLGGEGVLRTHGRIEEASEVIREAIDQGINYFDCARVYADSELYYGYVWKENPEIRAKIFQASKSASRDRIQALADLELAMISAPGGALEAFVEAKSAGKVRFIGVTGHHDPRILTQAVRSWPVDAVMMPVNPVEGILGGFLTETLPAARKKTWRLSA